jgi:hypothetical protein
MTNPPFLSKEVSIKRLIKAILLFIVLPITLFIGGAYIYLTIDNVFYEKYFEPCICEKAVLGTEKPTLIGEYGYLRNIADEYLWQWDWSREGYNKFNRYIDYPQYYHLNHKVSITDNWILKDGYKLELKCDEVDIKEIAPFDPYSCSLYYNDHMVTNNVTQVSFCKDFENYENCSGQVRFTLFSDGYDETTSPEYLVTGSWASGSKEEISIYILEEGDISKIPLISRDGLKDDVYTPFHSFELYKSYEDEIELVTLFHEPSMGSKNNVEGIYEIWTLKDGSFYLENTVVDLYDELETVTK